MIRVAKKQLWGRLQIRFSLFGASIAVLQLLPNIIWALFPPALNRLQGNSSSLLFIEYGEHCLGVAIVIMLFFLANKNEPKAVHRTVPGIASALFIGLYWLCWVLYYCGLQPNFVIYAMVVLPPAAFFAAGLAEKVYIISLASSIFVVFHLLVALENFPLWR